MPRKTSDKPLSVPLTPEQHAILITELIGDLSINDYIRSLIAQDAEKRTINWPDRNPSKLGV